MTKKKKTKQNKTRSTYLAPFSQQKENTIQYWYFRKEEVLGIRNQVLSDFSPTKWELAETAHRPSCSSIWCYGPVTDLWYLKSSKPHFFCNTITHDWVEGWDWRGLVGDKRRIGWRGCGVGIGWRWRGGDGHCGHQDASRRTLAEKKCFQLLYNIFHDGSVLQRGRLEYPVV